MHSVERRKTWHRNWPQEDSGVCFFSPSRRIIWFLCWPLRFLEPGFHGSTALRCTAADFKSEMPEIFSRDNLNSSKPRLTTWSRTNILNAMLAILREWAYFPRCSSKVSKTHGQIDETQPELVVAKLESPVALKVLSHFCEVFRKKP